MYERMPEVTKQLTDEYNELYQVIIVLLLKFCG